MEKNNKKSQIADDKRSPHFDYTKIRRRIEDTLRKTADNETLLRIARELSVKID